MKVLSYVELKPKKGIPYTRMHLRRLSREGRFPRPIRISEQRIGWLEHEIDAWLADRVAERDQVQR
jgi:prophage regulatory protein